MQEQVEITRHQPIGIALEVAPFAMIHETGGGDLGSRRDRAQFALFGSAGRPINRTEFIVLVFAHVVIAPPAAGPDERGVASRSQARRRNPLLRSNRGTARSTASAPGSSTKPSCCFRNGSRPHPDVRHSTFPLGHCA